MKRCLILTALAASMILSHGCAQKTYTDTSLPASDRAALLLKEMTLEEKVGQMCQYAGPGYIQPGQGSAQKNIDATDENLGKPGIADKIREGKIGSFLHVLSVEEAMALQRVASKSRLGIPLLIGVDAIHGNGLHKGCTVYPTSITMASSFNPEMMETVGAQTAQEMRASGMAWTFNPNLDVCLDPRWGRQGETFGEDPLLVSEMGKYLIWGLQGRDGISGIDADHVLACAKHLIAGGEPYGGINAAPMDISEHRLRETFLPPFVKAVKDAKVATVMTAHNEINGIPCHGNSWLIQDILRKELGFGGFVVSDWMDIERMHSMHHWLPSQEEAFRVSVEAGVDMHMQGDGYFETVVKAVRSGRIKESRIDEAVLKILEAKFALGLFENPYVDIEATRSLINTQEHRATALEGARQSIVMLKNDNILPLDRSACRRIFVVGPDADSQTLLGDWAVTNDDDDVVTVLDGIKALCPDAQVDALCFGGKILDVDDKGIAAAAAKARMADVCIVVLGENSERYAEFGRTCGENCDRDNLDLPGRQQDLLEAVYASGRPTVLVLLNGRALSLVWADEHIPAILEAWEPGMLGGQAVAEILFGDVNPSGKLPVTVPYSVGQVPTVYNHKHSQYSRQFALTHTGPLYPFGFGLSYTTFEYGDPSVSRDEISAGESVDVSFKLSNTGAVDGTEIVQLYIRDEYGSVTRPVKELKAFRRVDLKAGESADVSFTVTPDMLKCLSASGEWLVEPGDFTIMVGSSSADSDLLPLPVRVK